MATTKRQPKQNLVAQPVEPIEEVVLDGNLEVVNDEQTKVQLLEAELAALKAQLADAKAQEKTRTAKPKQTQAEREAKHEAAKLARETERKEKQQAYEQQRSEEIARLHEALVTEWAEKLGVTPEVIRSYEEYDIGHAGAYEVMTQFRKLEKSINKQSHAHVGMKPYSQWKPAVHFSAQDALEVVELHRQGVSKAEIARRKGCNPTYISNILAGKQWSKVTGIEK